MTNQAIKQLLIDGAEGARHYEVSVAAAVSKARRRRAVFKVAPLAAALAIVGVLVATWAGTGPVRPTGDLDTPGIAGCPGTVRPPHDVISLPPDRAIGVGCLTYRVDGSAFLLAGDGSHYRLGEGLAGPLPGGRILSPDGRWLAVGDAAGTAVRNLMSTDVVEVAGAPLAWSPDSRWLALGPLSRPGEMGPVTVLELATSHQTTVDLSRYADTQLVSILPTGDIVLAPLESTSSVDFIMVDSTTGETRRTVHVELTASLTESERSGSFFVDDCVFTTNGWLLVRPMRVLDSVYVPGDVLVVDLNTSTVVRRWPLPTPTATEAWQLVEMLPEGLVLEHTTPTRALGLELYDPTNGQLRPIIDLSALPGGRS